MSPGELANVLISTSEGDGGRLSGAPESDWFLSLNSRSIVKSEGIQWRFRGYNPATGEELDAKCEFAGGGEAPPILPENGMAPIRINSAIHARGLAAWTARGLYWFSWPETSGSAHSFSGITFGHGTHLVSRDLKSKKVIWADAIQPQLLDFRPGSKTGVIKDRSTGLFAAFTLKLDRAFWLPINASGASLPSLSPDGKFVWFLEPGGNLCRLRFADGVTDRFPGPSLPLASPLAADSTSTLLAVGEPSAVSISRPDTGAVVHREPWTGKPTRLMWSTSSRFLAIETDKKQVEVRDISKEWQPVLARRPGLLCATLPLGDGFVVFDPQKKEVSRLFLDGTSPLLLASDVEKTPAILVADDGVNCWIAQTKPGGAKNVVRVDLRTGNIQPDPSPEMIQWFEK